MRKWREIDSTFPHSLSISSLFLHFLPLFPFPTSKCITFCCKMLNTALLSRMSQKSQHTRYEEIILGRTCCEEAPQFVPACGSCRIGGFLFGKVFDIRLCMFPSCSHCFTGLRTHFVFSLAQLLPMVVDFFGFNGNFNWKMTKINKMAKNHFSGVQNGSQSV